MPEDQTKPITLIPESVLKGSSPLVLTATLRPVAGLDRFQPAGFPEIGHVIYKAPRQNGEENVCIVDSPASMANHLESVCLRGPHDLELHEDLAEMPYLRCVTGDLEKDKLPPDKRELVVTSLTEGHRIASDYFLKGRRIALKNELSREFGAELMEEFKAQPLKGGNAYLPPASWWSVFKHIYRYDPNSLVHGVLFPKWQIKIARFLTAHLEAFGAGRVDRSGVKFDRLGKTDSGQPIFAIDDAFANEIRATFILDISLLRSFGRKEAKTTPGLSEKQKEFIVSLAFWKINQLTAMPFRYRSGCHLECVSLKQGENSVKLDAGIKTAIQNAEFRSEKDQIPIVTDVFWSRDELYREGKDRNDKANSDVDEPEDGDGEGS
jgi:CRISPR-associated protein Csb1